MLETLYAAVTDLPVIIQGAMGSALFAAFVYVGQRLFSSSQRKLSQLSKDRRRRYLLEQQIKYNVLAASGVPERGAFVSLLLYRASHSLFKALIWLTTGLIFGSVEGFLGLVGYFGCIYYLLLGLNSVTGPEPVEDKKAKLEEVRAELAKLDEA